jgi:hypothetical protein
VLSIVAVYLKPGDSSHNTVFREFRQHKKTHYNINTSTCVKRFHSRNLPFGISRINFS